MQPHNTIPTKVCATCGQTKPIDEFTIDRARRDGHYVYCKHCLSKRGKNRRVRKRARDRANNPSKYAVQPGETFKEIPGFGGRYQVSDFGRARSFTRVGYGRILRPSIDQRGYAQITLVRGGRKITRTMHSLVLETFVSPRPDGMFVNHIDGNPSNNHLDNLEWVTPSENVRHSLDVLNNPPGVPPRFSGEQHPQARLTWDIVRRLRKEHASGVSAYKLSQTVDVSYTTVKQIICGNTWKESE